MQHLTGSERHPVGVGSQDLLQEQPSAHRDHPAPAPASPEVCDALQTAPATEGPPRPSPKAAGMGFSSDSFAQGKGGQGCCRAVGVPLLGQLEEALPESRSELKGGKRPWISLGM